MPSYMASLHVLEFLLRKARDIADGIPDLVMQDEPRAALQKAIRTAHSDVSQIIGDIERYQAAKGAV